MGTAMTRWSAWALVAASLFFAGCGGRDRREAEVDFASCLAQLTNVAAVARMPLGKARMVSSYDRTGGNNDSRNFVGTTEDGSYILADLEGPGCVRRIWFTSIPKDDRFRFYFDGEQEPRLVLTSRELSEGTRFPFAPPLCASLSGGVRSYIPIPYANSLRILAGPKQGGHYYYHINYESYPAGTTVRSFRPDLQPEEEKRLREVAAAWQQLAGRPRVSAPAVGVSVNVPAGQEATVFEGRGPAMIDALEFDLQLPDDLGILEANAVLRELVMRGYWDGESSPSIEVPFGDFFCNGARPVRYVALPLAVTGHTYACRFPMPFQSAARLVLANDGAIPVTARVRVDLRPLNEWDPAMLYFHAAWRTSVGAGRPHTILSAAGAGAYVGCYLIAAAAEPSWNILESDERLFLDGEATPSMHGTGLEDYFNGAWYYASGTFSSPLSGCLERRGIRSSQYRFHLPDRVRFDDGIKVEIEFGDGNRSRGYMSSVAYWYARTPARAPYGLPPVARRACPADPIERVSAMCEVWEREKVGHLGEARDLCLEFAGRYPGTPQAELMLLRALAYREHKEGHVAVRPAYEAFLAGAQTREGKQQAQWLLGLGADTNAALLAAHINARYKVYLDGEPMLSGDDLTRLDVAPVVLTPGQHAIAMELSWIRPDNWYNVCLRTHRGDVRSDTAWRVSQTAAEGWKLPGFDDGSWQEGVKRGLLPKIQFFQFEPNGFVLMQHGQLTGPPKGWDKIGRRVFVRKEFTWPLPIAE